MISKRVNRSENALVITLKVEGQTFSFVDPTGQGYTVKLDGTEARFNGDLSGTTVSVKRVAENAIEETDKHGGKIEQITRFVVSADGRTLTATIKSKAQNSTRTFVLRKQSAGIHENPKITNGTRMCSPIPSGLVAN